MRDEPQAAGGGARPLQGLRVLVLFGGERWYGQERANLTVFQECAALGLVARFVVSSRWGHKEMAPELDRLGLEWVAAPYGYQWGRYLLGRQFVYWFVNFWGVVVTNWKIHREIRRWRPTHLYVMNCNYYSYAMVALGTAPLPLIYRAGDELPRHSWLHRWLTKKLVARADLMVCNSEFLRGRCEQAGVPRQLLRVIHNFPPVRGAAPPPNFPAVPPGATVVLFVGQISEHKGVSVLVEAMSRLVAAGENLVLWLAGDYGWDCAGYRAGLEQKIAAAGHQGRIEFLGFVENVPALLERADFHVCPSLFDDPLANVVSEAKLAGKASVIFPRGGLPELIAHGVDGYLCRDTSVEALMDGIQYFANDPAGCRRAGVAARRSLDEKFGRSRFRQEWAGVFMNCRGRR